MILISSDIRTTVPPPGGVAVWLTGQAGVVIKGVDQTLFIDPYLSDMLEQATRGTPKAHVRLHPPAVTAAEVDWADLVLCTHRHRDHMDPLALPEIARVAPQTRFVVPRPELALAEEIGIGRERLTGAVPGQRIPLGERGWVEPVPAAHEGFDQTPTGDYPYLGYIIRLDGVTLYHAGDTLVYDGLAERLRALQVEIAFLPINGRDYRRSKIGITGNMSYREAADLAADAGARLLVPVHWGMHAVNTERPGALVDYAVETYPGLRIRVLGCGEAFLYGPGGQLKERGECGEPLSDAGNQQVVSRGDCPGWG
ncbi:MAG TPA: MBL fold metallo-hydrolase [Symbiobacteriaceae bacterium]|nr:MBL fold metallo-hydrolase [Symbiobacteriaceae bacterium]